MTDLITRIEQADGPRRELFEEVWAALGNQAFSWDDWHHPDTPAFHKWSRYQRMLDAEAWTSAAEMLVPEGCGVKIDRYWIAEADGPVWSCTLFFGGIPSNPSRVLEVYDTAHPSLALLAAILRAERNEP